MKQIISPNQAILLLMETYKDIDYILDELKKIYLSGAQSSDGKTGDKPKIGDKPNDIEFLKQLIEMEKDKSLKDYTVKFDDRTLIDDDPSRRYFETHLALETLIDSSKEFSTEFLDGQLQKFKDKANLDTLGIVSGATKSDIQLINKVLTPNEDVPTLIAKILSPDVEDIEQIEAILSSNPDIQAFLAQDENKTEDIQILFEKLFVDMQTMLSSHDSKSNFFEENKQYFAEYIEAMNFYLKSPDLKARGLDAEEQKKIVTLLKMTFLSLFIAQYRNDDLPFRIYGKGIFSPAQRGNLLKEDQDEVRSQNMGVMKSYHPLPSDDAAFSHQASTNVRPADRGTYQKDAKWVKENFDKLVHPYSNSISGTMLIQLAVIMYFIKKENDATFTKKDALMDYMRFFISTMLYSSGGHTLNEFVSVMQQEEIRKGFKFIPGFSEIDIHKLFYQGNERAFDKALEDTINYNKTLLAKQRLNADLATNKKAVLETDLKTLTLNYQYYQQSLLNQIKVHLNDVDPTLYAKIFSFINGKEPLGIHYLFDDNSNSKKIDETTIRAIRTALEKAKQKDKELDQLLKKYKAATDILESALTANLDTHKKIEVFKQKFTSHADLFDGKATTTIGGTLGKSLSKIFSPASSQAQEKIRQETDIIVTMSKKFI